MVDITKCTGGGCPLRNECKRYVAAPDIYRQSYANYTAKVVATLAGYTCEFFIPGTFEKRTTSETKS